ncbi:hypothetical protein G6F23_016013 [Rhizopus arrhizus]|nr:hypothetical protein G6F23_016013 [Rhizopus arrhizus]
MHAYPKGIHHGKPFWRLRRTLQRPPAISGPDFGFERQRLTRPEAAGKPEKTRRRTGRALVDRRQGHRRAANDGSGRVRHLA